MKKRWLCIASVAILLCCLTACGTANSEKASSDALLTSNPASVSEQEINAIQTFLNDRENNGFISSLNLYSRPEDVELYFVLSEGAGISRSYDELTEEEKTAGIYSEFMPDFVFRVADIEALLQEKADISLNELTHGMNEHYYSAKHVLYAIAHTDTNYIPVTVTEAQIDKDGQYRVTYYEHSVDDDLYVVTLRKIADGYQFISNVRR